jgi:pilus assembly protein CpaC
MANTHRENATGDTGGMLRILFTGWAILCLLTLSTYVLAAEERDIETAMRTVTSSKAFEVPLYKSRILDVDKPVRKLSIGNPDIADILVLRANQVYVVGKSLGTTNVVLWDASNRIIATIDIEITHDVDTLKAKLHELLPNEDISVNSSQGTIILSGEVSGPAKMDAALALATSFAPEDEEGNTKEGKVVNLMHVGGIQQVLLEVKVAEINRTVMREFGIDWNAFGLDAGNWIIGGANGGAGPIGFNGPFVPESQSILDSGFFTRFLSDNFLFSATINAAKNNGLAKILAEPNLTTLSGQEATFLSGGEFPIPVPRGIGTGTTIEFKDFGIGMGFVPVVLDADRINMKIDISVSEIARENIVNVGDLTTESRFIIPSLTVRRATSTVEMGDGQTVALAGLLSEKVREDVQKFPGLGDVPVLGYLFKSQQWLNEETELVIFVTPHLAQPVANDLVRLPTEAFIEPNDIEYYIMGRMEGRGQDEEPEVVPAAMPSAQGGLEGSFGHQL